MDDAIKEVFEPLYEAMLQGERKHYLGYESNDKGFKKTANRRNGYGSKTIHTTKGDLEIEVPRDRDASSDPQIIKKRQTECIRDGR